MTAYSIRYLETEGIQEIEGKPCESKISKTSYFQYKRWRGGYDQLLEIGRDVFLVREEAVKAARKRLERKIATLQAMVTKRQIQLETLK